MSGRDTHETNEAGSTFQLMDLAWLQRATADVSALGACAWPGAPLACVPFDSIRTQRAVAYLVEQPRGEPTRFHVKPSIMVDIEAACEE